MERIPENPQKPKKSIYDVGLGSIFFRNFLAGFARAFGAITLYLILGGLIYYLVISFVLPQIQRFIPDLSPFLGPPSFQSSQGADNEQQSMTITQQQIDEAMKHLREQQSQPSE
jgi:hypothetical protein